MLHKVKISVLRKNEEGEFKRGVEQQLLKSMLFTETEQRITKMLSEDGAVASFEIKAVVEDNVAHFVPSPDLESEEGGKWYRCKFSVLDMDKPTKRHRYVSLVYALSINQAGDFLKERVLPEYANQEPVVEQIIESGLNFVDLEGIVYS